MLGRWPLPFFYGWLIVGVCFVAEFFVSGLGNAAVPLFFQPMRLDLGWSLSQLVAGTTAAALAGMLVAPFLGTVIDRVGVKPVMLWGSLIAGAGMLAMMAVGQVWQFWLLYAAIAALGLHEVGQLTSTTAVSKWFIRKRGRAISISTLGQPLGQSITAPIVGLLIGIIGWRSTWGVMGAAFLLLMLPLVLVFMRNRPEDLGLLPDGAPAAVSSSGEPQEDAEQQWGLREAFRTRSLWLLLGAFVLGGGMGGVMTNLAPFLIEVHRFSTAEAGWALSAFMACGVVGRITWGILVERLPPPLCLSLVSLGRGLGCLSLVVFPFPWGLGAYMLVGGIMGGAYGILQPVMFANYFGRRSFGSIMGAVRPFVALPSLVMPLLVSFLYDVLGSFTLGFAISSALCFAAALVALSAKPPPRRPAEAAAGPLSTGRNQP